MAVIIYLQKDKYICMKNILLILLIIFTSSCSFRKDFKVLDRLEPIIEPIVEPIKEFLIENTLENNLDGVSSNWKSKNVPNTSAIITPKDRFKYETYVTGGLVR